MSNVKTDPSHFQARKLGPQGRSSDNKSQIVSVRGGPETQSAWFSVPWFFKNINSHNVVLENDLLAKFIASDFWVNLENSFQDSAGFLFLCSYDREL